jgi:7-cyano-7-deazaguanine tRNA-ribosyltransferase
MINTPNRGKLSNDIGSFEILYKDLLGRIGKLKTKSGYIETPCLLPVVNITKQPISMDELYNDLNCKAIMTNAYLLKKRFESSIIEKGIHEFLGFEGVVFTDSGAYQILTYGEIDVEPLEIVFFEEDIGSDIAVILDFPTGVGESRKKAEFTIKETLKRSDEALKKIRRKDILWVGPVQGGTNIDLVKLCSQKMSEKNFSIYALGSPTKVMESYKFETLFNMIFTAKSSLPINRPFHLFGAGHPFMFSLAAAAGCDMFDSAAYVIYARDGRYLTEYGTSKIEDMKYFPCSCPICVKNIPKDLLELSYEKKIELLSKHNLYICFEEIKRIKEAILEGRLWELIEIRTRSHPSLLQAMKCFKKYKNFLEENTPSSKNHGIFFFGRDSTYRPEVVRYRKKIIEDYKPPKNFKRMLLLPTSSNKPFIRNRLIKYLIRNFESFKDLQICIYSIPFGIIPLEISDMFPLSQTEICTECNEEVKEDLVRIITDYLIKNDYEKVMIYADNKFWDKNKLKKVSKICDRKKIDLNVSYYGDKVWNRESFEKITNMLEIPFNGVSS